MFSRSWGLGEWGGVGQGHKLPLMSEFGGVMGGMVTAVNTASCIDIC